MKRNIKIDRTNEALIMSKAFFKKASIYGTAEYRELEAAMADCKGYEIKFKSERKMAYKNLTFQRMEDYIRTQADSEARLVEFKAVQRIAETKGGKYPLTKKWFLDAYPEYKAHEINKSETAITTSVLTAEAEREDVDIRAAA